jgi:hypothetical protein
VDGVSACPNSVSESTTVTWGLDRPFLDAMARNFPKKYPNSGGKQTWKKKIEQAD